jgi:hypothetical protein
MGEEAGSGADPRGGGAGFSAQAGTSGQAGVAGTPMVDLTDFHVPGTQVGDVPPEAMQSPDVCAMCHSGTTPSFPSYGWSGSLMGQAGRDPLFLAQVANANQDVPGVGYYCLRCHVPMSVVTGNALDPTGDSLNSMDRTGVSCHFCHSMVDPMFDPSRSPPGDEAILQALADPPEHYGNAMFVLDPTGLRRGPFETIYARHEVAESDFFRRGEFCGTCHDVGNVAVSRNTDGTYRYNAASEPAPDSDPLAQFPLERTNTEWRLSAFARTGVDMGGRFEGDGFDDAGSGTGGTGGTAGAGPELIRTCQDCHMPKTSGMDCMEAPARSVLPSHELAGAAEWVLRTIAIDSAGDPAVDPVALARGIANARSMLERAASLELTQAGDVLRVRVVNETGHKLPTGHIEGRRAWVNVKLYSADDTLLEEYGGYNADTAELDVGSTVVYEMHVGLSEDAAAVTGLPAGVTGHMSLADTIEKDTRIPPRGFENETYEAAGAPVVGAVYADGQYWSDVEFPLVAGTVRAVGSVNYQIVTREYIEALRDGNTTNDRGERLHELWLITERAAPFAMAQGELEIVLD